MVVPYRSALFGGSGPVLCSEASIAIQCILEASRTITLVVSWRVLSRVPFRVPRRVLLIFAMLRYWAEGLRLTRFGAFRVQFQIWGFGLAGIELRA